MRNLTYKIFIAFLISIVMHVLLYITLDRNIQNNKLQINTTNKIMQDKKNGFTTVKYVKLKKKQEKLKKAKKVEKNVVKKKVVKKVNKKAPKKRVVKTIQLPNIKEKIDLKHLFTIQKQKEKSPIEKLKEQKEFEEQRERAELRQLDEVTQSYIKLYGKQYFTFSKEQKRYLKENLSRIGRITQRHLSYPGISIRTRQSGINVVEFMLHPNGDITDLKLIDSSHYTALDQNSIETIQVAYKDYPKPSEPTQIKIYVRYVLY